MPHRRRQTARHRHLRLEPLETRRLLTSNWQNPVEPLDVTGDGNIAPNDVLAVVNALNQSGAGVLPAERPVDALYLDPSGDGRLSPVDPLVVINFLNSRPSGPLLQVALVDDTFGGTGTDNDRVTRVPLVAGRTAGASHDVELLVELDGAAPVPVAVADDGTFLFNPPLARDGGDDGVHELRFRATNGAGGTTVRSLSFELDTVAPSAPTHLALIASSDSGVSDADGITRETNPTIHVAADPGNFVEVTRQGTVVHSFVSSGPTTFELANAPEGQLTLRASSVDAAGNVSRSLAAAITIDRTAPAWEIDLSETVRGDGRTLDLVFGEPLAPATLDTGSFLLQTLEGDTVTLDSVAALSADRVRVSLTQPLAEGDYQLALNRVLHDLAGNSLPAGTTEEFTFVDPAAIQETSPAAGETESSVFRDVVVRFDEPVDPATITAASIRVEQDGQAVAATTTVSSTRRFATLVFDEPLPDGRTLQLVVDGQQVRGTDGHLLDADSDGSPGGVFRGSFRTASLARVPGTVVYGYVRDSYSGQPIEGVTIRVDGLPEANAVTDETGRFEIVDAPAPVFFVHIDGGTATSPPSGFRYPVVGKPFHGVAGRTTQLSHGPNHAFDIFLPPMSDGDLQTLSDTAETVVGFGTAGQAELQAMFPDVDPTLFAEMQVQFPAGSAIDDQGNSVGQATVIPVPADRIPAPLPSNIESSLVVSIQAPGATRFDNPPAVRFPNVDNLPPGGRATIMSFDHDAGHWRPVGSGTVTADGKAVQSDPGVGILAPGWHLTNPGVIVSGEVRRPTEDWLREHELPLTGANLPPPSEQVPAADAYVAFENLDTGFVFRTRADQMAHYDFVLGFDTDYRASYYDAHGNLASRLEFRTIAPAPAGQPQASMRLPRVIAGTAPLTDDDGDELTAVGEYAVGTLDTLPDTDADGIDDLAELRQGLSPLGDDVPAVGILGSAQLPDPVTQLIPIRSPQDSDATLVVALMPNYGIGVVDISNPSEPIVLSTRFFPNANFVSAAYDERTGFLAVIETDDLLGGAYVLDLDNPEQPVHLRTFYSPVAGVPLSSVIAADDGYLYAIYRRHDGVNVLATYDLVSSLLLYEAHLPGEHREVELFPGFTIDVFETLNAHDMVIHGDTLYVAGNMSYTGSAGVAKFTLTNGLAELAAAATLENIPAFFGSSVSVSGDLVAVIGNDSPEGSPGVMTLRDRGDTLELLAGPTSLLSSVDGTFHNTDLLLYEGVDAGTGGFLGILDLDDPTRTDRLLTTMGSDVLGSVWAVGTAGSFALVGNMAGQLHVVNYLPFESDQVAPEPPEFAPVADGDPVREGIQRVEGETLPLAAITRDDGRLLHVELLVDGQRVARDEIGPHAFRYELPLIEQTAGPLNLTLRAVDSRGRVAVSEPLVVELLPDEEGPATSTIAPTSGWMSDAGFLQFVYDEPVVIDSFETLVTVEDAHGQAVNSGAVSLSDSRRLLTIDVASLPPGRYRATVDNRQVFDRLGNRHQTESEEHVFHVAGELGQVSLGEPIRQLTRAGDFAVALTDAGVATLDVSEPAAPNVIDQWAAPVIPREVAVGSSGEELAVALGTHVQIIQVEAGGTLSAGRTFSIPASRLLLDNARLYAAAGNLLRAIDAGTGERLWTVPLDESGQITSLARSGRWLYAYVSDRESLVVVDAASGRIAHRLEQVGTRTHASNMAVGDAVLWLTTQSVSDGAKLTRIDLADASQPQVSEFSTPLAPRATIADVDALDRPVVARHDGGLDVLHPIVDGTELVVDSNRLHILEASAQSLLADDGLIFAAVDHRLHVIAYDTPTAAGPTDSVRLTLNTAGIDEASTGTQITHSTPLSLRADVTSKTLPVAVEFYRNGERVGVDSRYPFTFTTDSGSATATGETFSARAIFAGGPARSSAPLAFDVVAPAEITANVNRGQLAADENVVEVSFSHAVAPASLDASDFSLTGSTSNGLQPAQVEGRAGGRRALLHFDALPPDSYTLSAAGDALRGALGEAVAPIAIAGIEKTYAAGQLFPLPIVDRISNSFQAGETLARDWDLDGDQDLLVARDGVSVFEQTPVGYDLQWTGGELGINLLAVEDFDGDGFPDLAVAVDDTFDRARLRILGGHGDGSFSTIFQRTEQVFSAQPIDWNGDGALDLIARRNVGPLNTSQSELVLLLGDGRGRFGEPIPVDDLELIHETYATGALQPGAPPSLVVGSPVHRDLRIYQADGAGGFTPFQSLDLQQNPNSILLGDFNGDQQADVAVNIARGGGAVTEIYWSDGSGGFQTSPRTLASSGHMSAGDLDGDGDDELVLASRNDFGVSIFGFQGGDFELLQEVYQWQPVADETVLTDANNDGHLDVISISEGDLAEIYLGNGDGTVRTHSIRTQFSLYGQLAAGDLQGDSRQELVLHDDGVKHVSLVSLNPAGQVVSEERIDTLHRAQSLSIVDVNNDGRNDLVIAAGDSGSILQPNQPTLEVHLGNGDGTFAAPVVSQSGTISGRHELVGHGQLAGDGNLDLVTRSSRDLYIWSGLGDGSFALDRTIANAISSDRDEWAGHVGDLDNDGDDDLAVTNSEANVRRIDVRLQGSDGSLDVAQSLPLGSRQTFAVGLVDGDAFPDIVSGNGTWSGSGSGSFMQLTSHAWEGELSLVDINHDGLLDVLQRRFQSVFTAYARLGQGDGRFGRSFIVGASRMTAAALLDDDALVDLAQINNGQLRILLNQHSTEA